MITSNPPRRGRPPTDPAKRLLAGSIRLTAADWHKLVALGGVDWLRLQLERATVAPPAHAPRRKASSRSQRLAELFVLDAY